MDSTTDTGLSAAELAYFQSGGEVTDGLAADVPASPDPAPEPAAEEPAPAPEAAAPETKDPAVDDGDDDEVDAPDTGEPQRRPGTVVSRRKYERLAIKSRQMEADLAKAREMQARFDERLRIAAEAMQQPPQKPAEPPSLEEDPAGYVKWLGERVQEIDGRSVEAVRSAQSLQADQQLRTIYTSDAQRFAAQQPDFWDAYSHLIGARGQQLELLGHSDPRQRSAMLEAEEKGLVARALQAGMSPAEYVYKFAQAYGYRPRAPEPPPAMAQQPAPPAERPAPKAPSVTDELSKIQKAQAAHKSLSSTGGSPGGQMTLAELVDMPEDQFKAWARKNPALLKEMMGG